MNKKNPRYWKTNNPADDVKKFELVRKSDPGKGDIKKETIDLQIEQVKAVNKEFPLVRFYGFHKSAKEFAEKHYGCIDDYEKCSRLPDGYYFAPHYGIFIIEIENYSRIDDDRLYGYLNWWDFFDGIEYTALHIMEFNRYGKFQKDIIKESFDARDSVEILKNINKKEDRNA